MIKLGNASLEEWKEWIKEELNPPIVASDETIYVLKAFLQLIELYEEKNCYKKKTSKPITSSHPFGS